MMDAWNQRDAGAQKQQAWQAKLDAYRASDAAKAAEFERRMNGELAPDWSDAIDTFAKDQQELGAVLQS